MSDPRRESLESREPLKRREFLRTLGRGLLLAGIGALALRLLGPGIFRRRGGGRTLRGQTCINLGVCRGCSAFSGCGLPQALSARQRAPWARIPGPPATGGRR
jgi:hypothetical protein